MTPTVKLAALFPILLALACATTKPSVELLNARKAYGVAQVDATRAAPTELHAARLALDAAEAEFANQPKSTEVNDLSYIAQRRAEIASARAAVFISDEHREASNVKLRSLGAAAAGELRTTQSELRTTQDDLSDAEQKVRLANLDVHGLKTDLKASESKASGLKTDLKVSESKADSLSTRLQAETQARREAEASLTATLMAMRDLQSVKEEPRGLVITLSGAVLFASGQSVLLPAARAALDNVAEALKGTPHRAIMVEGHTDSQGGLQSNILLSQRRGDAVRSYLVSRGIADATIKATGLGPNQPVATNATPEGRANNRRVEIVLAPAPVEAR